jgi:hypothetical protein
MQTLERRFWWIAAVALVLCAGLAIKAAAALLSTGFLRDDDAAWVVAPLPHVAAITAASPRRAVAPARLSQP